MLIAAEPFLRANAHLKTALQALGVEAHPVGAQLLAGAHFLLSGQLAVVLFEIEDQAVDLNALKSEMLARSQALQCLHSEVLFVLSLRRLSSLRRFAMREPLFGLLRSVTHLRVLGFASFRVEVHEDDAQTAQFLERRAGLEAGSLRPLLAELDNAEEQVQIQLQVFGKNIVQQLEELQRRPQRSPSTMPRSLPSRFI